jgi:hypothetical protein
MPRDRLHNSKSPLTRSVDMHGLFPESIAGEVLECIERMVPEWSFDVRPQGMWGSGVLIRIRLWNGTHRAEIDVNPSHYINHPDPAARENPTLAALVDGINRFKKDLSTSQPVG